MASKTPNRVWWLILAPFSQLYGGASRIRRALYQQGWLRKRKLTCPVVSIGNLVAGGTGKTPMTQYIAKLCGHLGYRPVILSRGYKGLAERIGGVVSDGKTVLMTSETAGDEPFMLASSLDGIPVLVGQDRYQSGCMAIKRFNPDVILLDDGYQHIRLKRDLNLLLLDSRHPLGNGHMIPLGMLRDSPVAIQEAHAVVMTRAIKGRHSVPVTAHRYVSDKPLFYAYHHPIVKGVLPAKHPSSTGALNSPENEVSLQGQKVFAFSAIARNTDFFRSLERHKAIMVGQRAFSDHYRYRSQELLAIGQEALHAGAECLVTTAKDFARFAKDISFPLNLMVMDVVITFNEPGFDQFLSASLAKLIGKPNHPVRSS